MSHEQGYLVVSVIVIAAFIAYQYRNFPAYGWEAYIGLVLSFSGAMFALLRSI